MTEALKVEETIEPNPIYRVNIRFMISGDSLSLMPNILEQLDSIAGVTNLELIDDSNA